MGYSARVTVPGGVSTHIGVMQWIPSQVLKDALREDGLVALGP